MMCKMVRMTLLSFVLSSALAPAAFAQQAAGKVETRALAAATVQADGPRSGDAGLRYFNIEGKNNTKYASFGVVDFKTTAPASPVKAVASVELALTQSPARFSKDGKLKVYVAPDATAAISQEKSTLKFDAEAAGGVGSQLKGLELLGDATYKKGEKGHVDTLKFAAAGGAAAALLKAYNANETLRFVLIPADDDVAATYVGADPDAGENRPGLTLSV
ncbi:MAG: hypothetical protein U0794_14645 [Isosphaeraceae bacterium]